MSKEILFDKYGNEIVKLEVKYNDKLQSICMNCFRIGGVKWNDIDNGSFLTLTINKKDLIDQLVENEVKFDFDEDDDGETVKQVIVDDEKYIDIGYFSRTKSDLEAKLAESEKKHLLDEKEWQDYCAFKHIEPQIKGCLDREREYEKQLAEKDKAIENWQTMYKSVVQTCYNDKEEIERLNKQLETQENTITNLVEDNRASQEWYKKQIAETEAQNKRVLEKLDLIVRSNQELEKENTKLKEVVDCVDKLKQFGADIEEYALVNYKEADKIFCENEELKKQIAESESRFQAHKQNDARIIQDQTDLIENLKQQVKEKEKQLAEYSDINNALNSGLKDRCIPCEEEHNQDKISFAVEQLTEIRDYVKNCWSLDTAEGEVRLDIAKKIRLKIEELKGNENE